MLHINLTGALWFHKHRSTVVATLEAPRHLVIVTMVTAHTQTPVVKATFNQTLKQKNLNKIKCWFFCVNGDKPASCTFHNVKSNYKLNCHYVVLLECIMLQRCVLFCMESRCTDRLIKGFRLVSQVLGFLHQVIQLFSSLQKWLHRVVLQHTTTTSHFNVSKVLLSLLQIY